jgi:hypothetical protein
MRYPRKVLLVGQRAFVGDFVMTVPLHAYGQFTPVQCAGTLKTCRVLVTSTPASVLGDRRMIASTDLGRRQE